jgi:hypothetical protein
MLHLCAGNRWDNFYPVWARAEHRWYPTGRFAAYNQYVKDNIGQLTMKYAPGVSSQLSFELSDQYTVLSDVRYPKCAPLSKVRARGEFTAEVEVSLHYTVLYDVCQLSPSEVCTSREFKAEVSVRPPIHSAV